MRVCRRRAWGVRRPALLALAVVLGVLVLGGVSLAGSGHRAAHRRPHAVRLHFRVPRSVLQHQATVKRAYFRALHSRAARRGGRERVRGWRTGAWRRRRRWRCSSIASRLF